MVKLLVEYSDSSDDELEEKVTFSKRFDGVKRKKSLEDENVNKTNHSSMEIDPENVSFKAKEAKKESTTERNSTNTFDSTRQNLAQHFNTKLFDPFGGFINHKTKENKQETVPGESSTSSTTGSVETTTIHFGGARIATGSSRINAASSVSTDESASNAPVFSKFASETIKNRARMIFEPEGAGTSTTFTTGTTPTTTGKTQAKSPFLQRRREKIRVSSVFLRRKKNTTTSPVPFGTQDNNTGAFVPSVVPSPSPPHAPVKKKSSFTFDDHFKQHFDSVQSTATAQETPPSIPSTATATAATSSPFGTNSISSPFRFQPTPQPTSHQTPQHRPTPAAVTTAVPSATPSNPLFQPVHIVVPSPVLEPMDTPMEDSTDTIDGNFSYKTPSKSNGTTTAFTTTATATARTFDVMSSQESNKSGYTTASPVADYFSPGLFKKNSNTNSSQKKNVLRGRTVMGRRRKFNQTPVHHRQQQQQQPSPSIHFSMDTVTPIKKQQQSTTTPSAMPMEEEDTFKTPIGIRTTSINSTTSTGVAEEEEELKSEFDGFHIGTTLLSSKTSSKATKTPMKSPFGQGFMMTPEYTAFTRVKSSEKKKPFQFTSWTPSGEATEEEVAQEHLFQRTTPVFQFSTTTPTGTTPSTTTNTTTSSSNSSREKSLQDITMDLFGASDEKKKQNKSQKKKKKKKKKKKEEEEEEEDNSSSSSNMKDDSMGSGFSMGSASSFITSGSSENQKRPSHTPSRRVLQIPSKSKSTSTTSPSPTINTNQSHTKLTIEKDWSDLKTLGGQAYGERNYTKASLFYRQSLELIQKELTKPITPTNGGGVNFFLLLKDKAKLHANFAACFMMLGELTQAKKECLEAIQLDPLYTKAIIRIGRICLLMGELKESRKYLNLLTMNDGTLKQMDTKDHVTYTKLMTNLDKMDNLQDELTWYEKIYSKSKKTQTNTKIPKEMVDVLYQMWTITPFTRCTTLKQLLEALMVLKDFERVVTICYEMMGHFHVPSTGSTKVDTCISMLGIELTLMLCRALWYTNEMDTLHEWLNKLEEKAPCNVQVILLKQNVQLSKQLKKEANELFNKQHFLQAFDKYTLCLQKIDPDHFEYHAVIFCNRAASLMGLQKYAKALKDCKEALKRKEKYPRAVLRQARCQMALNQLQQAVDSFEQYLLFSREIGGGKQQQEEVEQELKEAKVKLTRYQEELKEKQRRAQAQKKQSQEYFYNRYQSFFREQPPPPPRNQNSQKKKNQKKKYAWDDTEYYQNGSDSGGHYHRHTGGGHTNSSNTSGSTNTSTSGRHRTYYEILGVHKTSTSTEIKKAYHKLALLYHPDKIKNKQDVHKYTDLFKDMTAAYGILSDPNTREKYDRDLILKHNNFGGKYYEC